MVPDEAFFVCFCTFPDGFQPTLTGEAANDEAYIPVSLVT